MNAKTLIKIVGLVSTVFTVGAAFADKWVREKQIDEKIEERLKATLSEREENDPE